MYLASEGLLIIVPMPQPRQWRVIAHIPSPSADGPTAIDAAALDRLVLERAGIQFGSHDVTWTSRFDLSHGVADHFRSGRIFVAGDAAHIHSPVGGQGLNTGVQDAHNLVWRLAESRYATPERAEELLDGYETERRTTAAAMVGGVARMTAMMTSSLHVARHIRTTISPVILSKPFVQAKLARGVGMLNLSYSKRAILSSSDALSPGNRLPNPALRDGGRLYDRVDDSGFSWVVLVGSTHGLDGFDPDAPHWAGLPVAILPESDLVDLAGARLTERSRKMGKNRVILVRPDRYIAAVGSNPESLAS